MITATFSDHVKIISDKYILFIYFCVGRKMDWFKKIKSIVIIRMETEKGNKLSVWHKDTVWEITRDNCCLQPTTVWYHCFLIYHSSYSYYHFWCTLKYVCRVLLVFFCCHKIKKHNFIRSKPWNGTKRTSMYIVHEIKINWDYENEQ